MGKKDKAYMSQKELDEAKAAKKIRRKLKEEWDKDDDDVVILLDDSEIDEDMAMSPKCYSF